MHAPTKVTDLEFTVNPEQKILRFNIPVNDVFRVKVNQGICHLIDIPRTPPLGERTVFSQLFVKFTLASKLQHEENAFLVVKVTVKSKNMWVSQVLLDFNFSSDLFLDAGLDDFGFVEAFESEDVFWFGFGTDHVDSPEFTLAERSTDVEVGEMPLAGWAVPELRCE